MRIDLDQNTLRGMDIDLQTTSLVQRRIEQSQKTLKQKSFKHKSKSCILRAIEAMYLMSDIWPGVRDISTSFCKDSLVIVAIQKSVFHISVSPVLASPTRANSVHF